MKKCPICRAGRTNEERLCRRCGSDLTWILDAQRLGRGLLVRAMAALHQGNPHKAAMLARRARFVHTTPYSRVVDDFLTHLDSRECLTRHKQEFKKYILEWDQW